MSSEWRTDAQRLRYAPIGEVVEAIEAAADELQSFVERLPFDPRSDVSEVSHAKESRPVHAWFSELSRLYGGVGHGVVGLAYCQSWQLMFGRAPDRLENTVWPEGVMCEGVPLFPHYAYTDSEGASRSLKVHAMLGRAWTFAARRHALDLCSWVNECIADYQTLSWREIVVGHPEPGDGKYPVLVNGHREGRLTYGQFAVVRELVAELEAIDKSGKPAPQKPVRLGKMARIRLLDQFDAIREYLKPHADGATAGYVLLRSMPFSIEMLPSDGAGGCQDEPQKP